jgi:hypothetical protein
MRKKARIHIKRVKGQMLLRKINFYYSYPMKQQMKTLVQLKYVHQGVVQIIFHVLISLS